MENEEEENLLENPYMSQDLQIYLIKISDVWFFWSQSWHAYSKCEPKNKWYLIYWVYWIRYLVKGCVSIPIDVFSFILTLDSCLVLVSVYLKVLLGTY